jgi:Asp-tRNA(Asn)/Glu-tRNA(Gln) amidotransferase A subunit family amidase
MLRFPKGRTPWLTARGAVFQYPAAGNVSASKEIDSEIPTPPLLKEFAMNPKQLHCMGLLESAQAIRKGDLSSEDLTRALLERIASHENTVQAFQWIDPARALDLARRADRRLQSGEASGPLQGIPIGIKDIIATEGVPTTMGSPIFDGHVPDRSAALVHRAEAAGAFVLGKTVTTEFAFYTPGKTRNPWNPAHTPGGSSSGSAAAVAMGFLPGAVGTQTNGSVIRPAAFCGVVGYKPTAGRISLAGVHPFSPSLDQAGVFARSVSDAALLAAALVERGDADAAVSAGKQGILGDMVPMARPPRLAAVRSPVWHLAEPHAQEHFLEMVARLRSAGAQVEEQELPREFEGAHAVLRTVMYGEGARVFAELQHRNRDRLSPRLNALIDEGLGIPDSDLSRGLAKKDQLARELDGFLSAFDGVITPPAPGEAPADLTQTGDPAFCTIWSLCGVPAVTIPAGRGPLGLPLGLQLVGPRLSDERILSVALWCDERVGWGQRIVD